MIQKMIIGGFKTLREPTEIPLEPITVLIGANNSGKSNVLAAIQLLGRISRADERMTIVRTAEDAPAWAPRTSPLTSLSLTVSGSLEGVTFRYSMTAPTAERWSGSESLQVGPPDQLTIELDREGNATFGRDTIGKYSVGSLLAVLSAHPHAPRPARLLQSLLRNIHCYDLAPAALRQPVQVSRTATLRNDGLGLAAVLDLLDSEAPSIREAIDAEVRAAAPEVRRIVTPTTEPGLKVVGVAERSGNVYSGPDVSDGLLLLIAISTIAYQSEGHALIGLEEIEKGIHPRRLRSILDLLTRLTAKGTQFVLTTHSPILLNEFRDFPERVLLCERDGEDTRVKRLSDVPDYEAAVNGTALGDIWYSGVLGGVPPGLSDEPAASR
ncbi:MAG TPA: ATP-binding protein [Myxococcales bacterium]|nr:ATP-binding protein [Myxococcales bacterium]